MIAAHACIDGSLVPMREASVSVTDDGLLRGDGAFEVLRIYRGRPFATDEHLARMDHSARCLRLAWDQQAVRREIDMLLAAEDAGEAQLRIVLTRGGRRILLLEELPQLPATVSLQTVTYAPSRVLDGVKSLSYGANMLASRIAREQGSDEALLVSPHGRVLECPTAAFFWVHQGRLITPPLTDHLLDSITRRIVIETCGADERSTTMQDLEHAEEALLASSVREVMGVHRIDHIELPGDGSVCQHAAEAVRKHIESRL